jgi:hypothetical protein
VMQSRVDRLTPERAVRPWAMEGPAEVRGAFDDVEDIIAAPTPFTPACDKYPLAPIAGPIAVRDAKASRGRASTACRREGATARRRMP